MLIFQILYSLLLLMIAVPILTLFIQVIAALLIPSKEKSGFHSNSHSASVVALVPAHNESINIIATINSLKSQTLSGLRILVVADNCDDDTASVVRTQGVDVIERFDQQLRGKGYALDFGIKYLSQSAPPDFVVIVDADCIAESDALERLVAQSIATNRPSQAAYLMLTQEGTLIKTKVAEFAWMLKNLVRPLGYSKLGLPCQLTGSGMSFPWSVLSKVNFATGHIVEDMKLGLDFASMGHAPAFCPRSSVSSYFPVNDQGLKTQRTRWEHGHLDIIFKVVPGLVTKAIKSRNWNLLAMAIDLLVPPLSLMAMIIVAVVLIGAVASLFTSSMVDLFSYAFYLFCLFVITILAYWGVFGRKVISLGQLLSIPFYILLKLPIYAKFIFNRQSEWVRSKRD
ncbi:glycosyltransferase [Methylophilus sp. Leaf414]|uniref:glycosyltransferase family 2 protein n=1 Tax=Methylophilus sp. Leaf414 TaxID=1736371 RepID=UPI0006F49E60|nr:glycosyltransferase family 2 protein [Methylophilus sp. Leaf414]KQT34480.1 glycosyl transferase [Methylophilus sp. Leaf414]